MGEGMTLVEETGYDKAWRQDERWWPLGEKGREIGGTGRDEVTEEPQKAGSSRPYGVWLSPEDKGNSQKDLI